MLKNVIKTKSKKVFFIVVAIVVIVIVAIALLLYLKTRPVTPLTTLPQNNGYVSNGVNYSPPVDADVQAGNDQQKALENGSTTPSSASLSITDANQYDDTVEARAFVSGKLENGGTCTATYTKGGQTVSTKSQAFTDASSIQCGALDINVSKFPSTGSYTLVVTYTSDTLNLTSASTKVSVTQ